MNTCPFCNKKLFAIQGSLSNCNNEFCKSEFCKIENYSQIDIISFKTENYSVQILKNSTEEMTKISNVEETKDLACIKQGLRVSGDLDQVEKKINKMLIFS